MINKWKSLPSALVGILILIAVIGITGCSKQKNRTETVVVLMKDGSVQSYITEDFEQSYYNKDDLQQMILGEVATYNRQAGEARIGVEKIEVADAKAIVQMSYSSTADYAEFNQEEFFLDVPSAVKQAGYHTNVVLSNVKNEQETIGEADILSLKAVKLLITDTKESIIVPGRILYVSDNVTVSENQKQCTLNQNSEEMAYIIFKE